MRKKKMRECEIRERERWRFIDTHTNRQAGRQIDREKCEQGN
jgi:hypothetical protein